MENLQGSVLYCIVVSMYFLFYFNLESETSKLIHSPNVTDDDDYDVNEDRRKEITISQPQSITYIEHTIMSC